jgi:hypothetical protein
MSRLNLRTNKVQSSFRNLQKRLSVLLRRLNAEAATQMKAGRYDAAKDLMDIGRSFAEFNTRVDEVGQNWDELTTQAVAKLGDLGVTSGTSQSKATSPKALCIPALRAVVNRGGIAEMSEIVSDLESATPSFWRDSDLAENGGRLTWHTTLDKAYRRSQRQGWIEKRTDGTWQVTAKGRAVIEENAQGR